MCDIFYTKFEDDPTWTSDTDIKQFVENLDTEESHQCGEVLLDQTQERDEADEQENEHEDEQEMKD